MCIETFLEIAEEELIKKCSKTPPKGEIWFDSKGKIICHVCGKSFDKLVAHTIQAHDMDAEKYKEVFELKHCAKLTSKSMSEFFRKQKREDITLYSEKTRFKKGEVGVKKGKKARLQILLENINSEAKFR